MGKGSAAPGAQQINTVSRGIMVALSVIAFLTVLIGYTQPPLPDEGTLAHVFQLSIGLFALTLAFFLATADWTRPLRSLRFLLLPSVTLAIAFGALFYLEHYR